MTHTETGLHVQPVLLINTVKITVILLILLEQLTLNLSYFGRVASISLILSSCSLTLL